MSTPISPGLRSEASGRIPDPRPLPGDPLQSEDFAKAGPVNYGRVNLACGTNGTEQRGSKVVVYGAVPSFLPMKAIIYTYVAALSS